MLPERQKQTYEAFFESTADGRLLDAKATVIAQLAAAFVIGCYP